MRRIEKRLSLTMEHAGREDVGVMEWTPPPAIDAVEKVLRANIGQPIKALRGLDV